MKIGSGRIAAAAALLILASTGAMAQSGGLNRGEYACYGSGGRLLIGLGFKVLDGSRYTDLDGKSQGTYAVRGDTVTFSGGHFAGQNGRALKNGKFSINMIGCEPFK